MLQSLLGPETINEEFVNTIMERLTDKNIDIGEEIDNSALAEVLKIAFDQLLLEDSDSDGEGVTYDSIKSAPKLGSGTKQSEKGKRLTKGGTMEEVLQNQADQIAADVEQKMDEILEELPEKITFAQDDEHISVDPEVLKMTKLAVDFTHELLWALGRPDAITDITLLTQLEDATEMMSDVLTS